MSFFPQHSLTQDESRKSFARRSWEGSSAPGALRCRARSRPLAFVWGLVVATHGLPLWKRSATAWGAGPGEPVWALLHVVPAHGSTAPARLPVAAAAHAGEQSSAAGWPGTGGSPWGLHPRLQPRSSSPSVLMDALDGFRRPAVFGVQPQGQGDFSHVSVPCPRCHQAAGTAGLSAPAEKSLFCCRCTEVD